MKVLEIFSLSLGVLRISLTSEGVLALWLDQCLLIHLF